MVCRSQSGAAAGLLLGLSPAGGNRGGAGPAAASALGLVSPLRGAVTLCVHLAGVVEGSPRGAHAGRGPGRRAAGLLGGSGGGDQAGDLGEPGEGGREEPARQEVPPPGPDPQLASRGPRDPPGRRGVPRRPGRAWPRMPPRGGSISPGHTYRRSSSSSIAGSCIRSALSGRAPRRQWQGGS